MIAGFGWSSLKSVGQDGTFWKKPTELPRDISSSFGKPRFCSQGLSLIESGPLSSSRIIILTLSKLIMDFITSIKHLHGNTQIRVWMTGDCSLATFHITEPPITFTQVCLTSHLDDDKVVHSAMCLARPRLLVYHCQTQLPYYGFHCMTFPQNSPEAPHCLQQV